MEARLDLPDFIASALTDIATGIARAAPDLAEYGVLVNPDIRGKAEDLAPSGVVSAMEPGRPVESGAKPRKALVRVAFDLAVTAESSGEGRVKVGVVPKLLGADLGGGVSKARGSEQRVRFEVPLLLPSYNSSGSPGEGGSSSTS